MVGDSGVGFTVVDGKGERRPGIVAKVIGDEMAEHWISLNKVVRGVEVLEKRKAKAFAYLITDGEEEEPAAVLPQLAHRCWFSHRCGEKKVGFALSLFRVKEAHRLTRLERFDCAAYVRLHGGSLRSHLHEESYPITLESNRLHEFSGQPTERHYHVMSLGSVSGGEKDASETRSSRCSTLL